ncbi:MAG: HEPN domain-containing protein [Methanosarcinales archaeon]|nr:HEPN domain-containing protein [Methanosarcinales archaeon]
MTDLSPGEYVWAGFQSQQSAEKALKAVLYFITISGMCLQACTSTQSIF